MQPDRNNIFTIPAGLSFADEFVKYLSDLTQGDNLALSRMLVLLPSRRACRTVREAFLRLSQGVPTVLPRLQPLGDVDADELTLAFSAAHDETLDIPPAISPLRRQIMLARLILALNEQTLAAGQRPRYDQALQLSAELCRLLDQVQTERVSFEALKDLVPDDFAEHWQITLQFLTILTEKWPDILADHNVIDPAIRRNMLLEAQADIWRQTPPDFPVIAAGTIASVPATLDLLTVIADMPQGQIVIPGLDRHLDEDAWNILPPDHPQYFIKQLLGQLNTARTAVRTLSEQCDISDRGIFWSEVMRPAETTAHWRHLNDASFKPCVIKQLNEIECANAQAEAETIAVIMREALETQDKTVALVAPDRHLARRVAGALKRWGIDVDDSAGVPLHHTIKGAFALSVGQMAARQFSPIEFLKTMKHPLTRAGFDKIELDQAVARIERLALRGIRPAAGLDGLRARLNEAELTEDDVIYHIITALQNIAPAIERADFKTHVRNHLEFLETIATGPDIAGVDALWSDEDGEALGLFFAELLQLESDIPPLDFGEYLLVLRQLLSQKNVRPKYGTHPRAFILGQLESRMFVADTLILSGLNEGKWPPEVSHDPWMSRQMRERFGLPAREQSVGIAAHDFVQLASAENVYLTRAVREGSGPAVPSRWLLRMHTVLEASGLQLSEQKAVNFKHWAQQLDHPDAVKPIARPAPMPSVRVRPKTLSVSGIERLMRDPYEVYARYILGLKALDPIDADPSAAERGQLIHDILERFVSAYPDSLPDDAAAVLTSLGRERFDDSAIPPEVESFWWPRFARLVDDYMREERAWRYRATPLKTEVKGRHDMQIGDYTFAVTAIADRIDQLGKNEQAAIIDYKTGSPPDKKDIAAGISPQLWLEALIARNGGFTDIPPMPVGYIGHWIVSGGQGRKINEEIKCDDYEQTIRDTEDGLKHLMETFFSDDTPYIARPNSNALPKFSDYTHFERVSEWVYDNDLDRQEVGS